MRGLFVQPVASGGFRSFAILSLIFNMVLNKQTQFPTLHNAVTPYFLRTKDYRLWTAEGKNEPKSKADSKPKRTEYKPNQSQRIDGFIKPATAKRDCRFQLRAFKAPKTQKNETNPIFKGENFL
jgi:hypothetical protein